MRLRDDSFTANTRANKTDAGNGSYGICRIITLIALAALLTGCGRDPDLSTLGTQPLTITTFSGIIA